MQRISQLDDAPQAKIFVSGAASPADWGPELPTSTSEWRFRQSKEGGLHLLMDTK